MTRHDLPGSAAPHRAQSASSFADAVRDAHILLTSGAGGVGKTTVAAALGVAGARAGRRTLVLTIDPARRLAQSMGLETLDDDPRLIDLPELNGLGELWAMALDMSTTFDRLIERHATSPAKARAITSNRIYRTLSSSLAGTQDYIATERLHELHEQGDWDLLVVDTPPTRSALDFLDAPKRMSSFMEGRLLQILTKPGASASRGVGRAVSASASVFMKFAGRVTGVELIEDLGEFFRNFDGMYDGFKKRADQVLRLLHDPSSKFVVVTSPEPDPLREARFFLARLEEEGLHTAGVVINRIGPHVPRDPSASQIERAIRQQPDTLGGQAIAGSLHLLEASRRVGLQQRNDIEASLRGLGTPVRIDIPLLAGDIHNFDGLGTIATVLTTGRQR